MQRKAFVRASAFFLMIIATSMAQAKNNGPQFPHDVSFTTLQDAANPGHSMLLPFAI